MNDLSEISNALLKFSLFSELKSDAASLAELAKLVHYETFKSREVVLDEKKTDDRVFFLLSGSVVVNKVNETGSIVTIAKLDASSHPFFGESVLVGKFKRIANVTAHTQCECLSLRAEHFEHFVKSYPMVAASIFRNIARVLFERLAKADQDVFIASLMLKK